LTHLALLVDAIHMFSSERITAQDLLLGRCLMRQVHEEFSTLYSKN